MPARTRLSNGLTLLHEAQHAAPVVAFQVWVQVGSADETSDEAGLAHLHEHMLFKGTARRRPGEIARDVERHGGEINAWTSFDQTVYHVVMASPFARIGLDVLADAVRAPAFDPGELAREVEVVVEEIKRAEDSPARRASRDLFATSYQVHPYRHPVLGTAESVRGVTRESITAFYRRHYTPDRMVLIAVGDLAEGDLLRWAEDCFGGDWERVSAARPGRPAEPPRDGRRVLLRPDEVKEAYLSLSFPIPAVHSAETPALDVLAMLAGQGETSRLVREVKRRRRLVNEIHAYAYTPRDPGLWGLGMTLPGERVREALEASAGVLEELRTSRVPGHELATLQALVESEAVYQRETVQGVARKLGFYETELGGFEAEAVYHARVAALTPESIQAAAHRWLRLEEAVVTALLPPGSLLSEQDVASVLEAASRAPASTARATPVSLAPSRAPIPALTGKSEVSGVLVERLANGATLVVREEHAVPLVAIRAAFHGGLRYETAEENGLTHLLGRLLTRGTEARGAEEISHLLDALSGSMGGAVGRNSVGLRAELLSRHFGRGFELFAECLLAPAYAEEELARERALVLQDIAAREDRPSALAFELFARTLWNVHPYRLPSLGERETVERLGADRLRAYHRGHLHPSQMTLCVIGDVRAEDVRARAEALFGGCTGAGSPPPEIPLEPPPDVPRRSERSLSRAQAHLVFGFQGLRVSDPQRHALDVLSTVLSGQGGRLFLELRDKRSMAYSVSGFSVEGVDPGSFAVYMGTSPDKLAPALEGVEAELHRMADALVSEPELARAREHLIGTHAIGLQRNGARAALLALDHCYGLGAENFLRYDAAVIRVTAADVQAVARRIIDFGRSALAVVGP